jgi:hypothetical protein
MIQKQKSIITKGLDDNNDSKGMYVYLLELKKVLDKTRIKNILESMKNPA